MQVGNLGSLITFEVSSRKVLTFKKLTQKVGGRWTTHAVIGQKPKSEFLGADLRSGQLEIFLNSMLGVRPRSVIENIESAVESGNPLTLVVGGKQIGSNRWVITEMSETWNEVILDGRLVSANVTLTLQEYV